MSTERLCIAAHIYELLTLTAHLKHFETMWKIKKKQYLCDRQS